VGFGRAEVGSDPHILDYAASRWHACGVPLHKIARWLGHTDAGSLALRVYVRDINEEESDREALRLLAGGAL